MLGNFRWKPDTLSWHREGRHCWVSNDGLSRCEKRGNVWVPSIRQDVGQEWQAGRYVYGALHAAQDGCRRMHEGRENPK